MAGSLAGNIAPSNKNDGYWEVHVHNVYGESDLRGGSVGFETSDSEFVADDPIIDEEVPQVTFVREYDDDLEAGRFFGWDLLVPN